MSFLKGQENGKDEMDSNTPKNTNETQFILLTDAMFVEIENWLEAYAEDSDFVTVAPGVLEVEMPDGQTMVTNRHEANGELWLASKSGAHHFRHDGKEWRDTRSFALFFEVLEKAMSASRKA